MTVALYTGLWQTGTSFDARARNLSLDRQLFTAAGLIGTEHSTSTCDEAARTELLPS